MKITYVHRRPNGSGKMFYAYRRGTFRRPLPDPSDVAFQAAYNQAAAEYQRERENPGGTGEQSGTVAAAITLYLRSARHLRLGPESQRHYRLYLDRFRARFGHLALLTLDYDRLEDLRTAFFKAGECGTWNETHKIMGKVTQHYMRKNPGKLAMNQWREVGRLEVPDSEKHRPWPDWVIVEVWRAATPQFRSLLTLYLFSGQRGGDVTRFGDDEKVVFDAARRTLKFKANKGGKDREFTAAESLARELTGPDGRSVLLTPRGRPWTRDNAQNSLRDLLTNLGLPSYTLHGLRATMATRLAHLGFADILIMAQGGWSEHRTMKKYTRGAEERRMTQPVAEALEEEFAPLMRQAAVGANDKRAAGVTGRAAAAAGITGSARERRRKAREEATMTAAKRA